MTPLDLPALVDPGSRRRAPAWEPVALRRADIERAVDQLLDAERADAGLRRFVAVHPRAGNGIGLAPGIEVSVEVLAPGEQAHLPRRNSSGLSVQLRGESTVDVNGRVHHVGPKDVYSVPPFAIESHTATGTEPSVRLSFSNAALLELLGAHHVEPLAMLEDGMPVPFGDVEPLPQPTSLADVAVRNDGRVERLGDDAFRLEYERLVDPPWLPRRSWLWRWTDVVGELDRMATLDERYRGRRVCLLHDPATGRTNGTTSTLFASMCIRPPSIVDTPHRHSAAAVNLFLEGDGWSTVDGRRIEWGPGDVVFIAPAWAVHHHASGDAPVYQLAVQDNPFHLAIGSLVWQEDLGTPARLLGAEPGFTTNRHLVGP